MRSLRNMAIALVTGVAICTGLASCGAGSTASTASNGATKFFHRLDWGGSYYSSPEWSPDGRSVALFMGDSQSDAHLYVASADGSKLEDEKSWNCNQYQYAAIAWLPDGGLSCVTPSGDHQSLDLSIAATLSAPVKSFVVPGGTAAGQYGAVWLPDGSALLASETVDVPPGTYRLGIVTSVHVITRDGKATQTIVIGDDLSWPRWVSGASTPTLSYLSYSTGVAQLATSTVTWTSDGIVTLGPPTPVPIHAFSVPKSFTWSPSGHWFADAQRATVDGCNSSFGAECDLAYTLVLIKTSAPDQQLQLVIPGKPLKPTVATLEGADLEVAWSPDGQTLLVTQVNDEAIPFQLYRFDVAKYLASQGKDA